jgi:type III secretion protein V
VRPDSLYVHAPKSQLEPLGVTVESCVVHPVTGKSHGVVPATLSSRLLEAGFAVLTPEAWLAEHVKSLLRRHAGSLLGLQDVQCLLEELEPRAPALVRECSSRIPLSLLTDVLRRLLAEQVSIRNLRLILETLVMPHSDSDPTVLVEKCRVALARHLSHRYAPTGPLFAYLVDPAVEEVLRSEASGLDPEKVGQILQAVGALASAGANAVLLSSPDIRRKLKMLCEPTHPDLAVLTYAELAPDVQIRPVGKLLPKHWS